MPTAGMIEALASNVFWPAEIIKTQATDGTTALYSSHTRALTFGANTYQVSPVEFSRPVRVLGLEPDGSEITGVFDDIITEFGLFSGKWRKARVEKQIVNYKDLTIGSVCKQVGQVSKVDHRSGTTWTIEFRSIAALLGQEIGDLTSPVDRNRKPEELGISLVPFTFARNVSAVTDQRIFTIDGVPQADGYFKYGRIAFTSGLNNGLSMEIEANVGNLITLRLPMPSVIAIGNTTSLIAGYDGSREQARDRFGATAILAFNGEPDLPGIGAVLKYPD